MRFSKKPKNHYRELRKSVKPGEVLVVPMDNRLLEEAAPYVAGGKNTPPWYKLTPKEGIRKCVGVNDYLDLGFILPAWTNISFAPNVQFGGWDVDLAQMMWTADEFRSEPFPLSTTGLCPMTSVRKIEQAPYPKLVNPFAFITAPGWSLMISGIPYEPNEHFDVVPAIVNTDYYHHMNIVLNLKNDQPFSIRYGDPLAHFIPFKRDGDIKTLRYADEKDYKYILSRGMGAGQFRNPLGVSRGYRQTLRKQDEV
jgi:hypothetical protein